MKNLVLLLALTALLYACQTTDPSEEKANVEAAITGFYDAVETFDYEAIPTFCTEDFGAYEEGYTYTDIKSFVETLKTMEGATGNIKLDFVKTEVSGDMAFSIVKFDAQFIKAPAKIHFITYENYILKKVNGNWLIHYFHSTHLPDPADTGYSSIHLFNVPQGQSISGLEDYLKKVNEAIASLGYADCGYKVLTVNPESNENYNYAVLGKWKNQETYKIIHESAAYKKASAQVDESVEKILQNQIYVQAEETE